MFPVEKQGSDISHGKINDMDDALFNLDSTNQQLPKNDSSHRHSLASETEIDRIRSTFANTEITAQDERKLFIENTLGREVSSLREILSHEVPRVIYGLNDIIIAAQSSKANGGSSWDDREEETWIDKL